MYGSESQMRMKAAELDSVEECPASAGAGSKLPRAALDRWIAARYALESALSNGGDVEKALDDNAAWLDPVQRELVADLVLNGVTMLSASDAAIEFDPEDSVVLVGHPELDIDLASYIQVIVTDPRDLGRSERLKIKTGRTQTTKSEAAILMAGSEPGESYADLMLFDGTIEPIELAPEEQASELERLYEIAGRERELRDRRPGWECYRCDRVARCGQYPAQAGYRVGERQRTIRISKSDTLRFDVCHRRLAWKALHVMPKDTEEEVSPAAARGILFHEVIGNVLLADDQDAAFTRELERVSAQDRQVLTALYERHRQIEPGHVPVEYRRTEYQVGSTFVLDGLDADGDGNLRDGAEVAVTVIARTDAVGREPDGTPAVIEHRTGKTSDRIDERETALYAISTARLLGVDTVAVHQHSLGGKGEPECLRIFYGAEQLEQAEQLMATVLAPIVRWHPLDATQPEYSAGAWCTTCPYRLRCERFRS